MPSVFSPPSTRHVNLGLAVLRVMLGVVFVAHGGQKLFVFGLDGVSGAFTQMGVPLPGITGPLVAVLEFFGGIALIVGLLTRLAGLGFVIEMLGAIFLVKMKSGFFAPNGAELELMLFAAALAVALAGAGSFAVDSVLARRRAAA